MRNNGYVSQRNQPLGPDDFLISRTDRQGNITYANPAFVKISGFTREELIDAPHNIVRHPDMPPEVFADMWATLKAGRGWQGIVKNRCKNGDHYWVHAHVVPLLSQGGIEGFASLRTFVPEEETRRAEVLYREMREGRCGYEVKAGKLRRKGWLGWLPSRQVGLQGKLMGFSLTAVGVALAGASPWFAQLPALAAWTLGGAASAGLLLAGWWLSHSLSRSVERASDFSLQIAAGNLASAPAVRRQDPLGQVVRSLDLMRKSLLSITGGIRQGADVIGPTASDMEQSNQAMVGRLEQQTAAIQDTAASMEEIASTVQHSADNAQLATEAANSNVKEVDDVVQRMQALATAMEAITQQTRNMAAMVDTIDNIAFQTNILALNASVEAARAGEHGRGFAVVAGEVRNLANQAADAAKKVQALIAEAGQGVAAGVEHTRDTETAMQRMREASHRVNDLMAEISAAAREQSEGVIQIGQAIHAIDRATQESTAEMQRYHGVTQSLRVEADSLNINAQAFSTGGAPQPARRRAVAPEPLALPKRDARHQEAAAEWESF
ncbi:methyl-accepting chemotaxis protein [Halomonas sp. 328]|uniref:methyl-accepting chemotaxis protein n=1 Tax=Halomonas sp. 328 TaxID=2776704 RepID=UPI0018A7B126|nr:PAS domain-containing methyl-accepting chemotaxis protein [Halomonas sp. 328]MBF8222146.1 PAS domain-containing protein [Halomonas sp. 328]